MSSNILRIEIETADSEILRDLQAQKIEGVRLMTRAFTCDSIDWVPPVEKLLSLIVETSFAVETGLLSAWLYDRFKDKPPEKLSVNGHAVSPDQIVVVINNYAQNIQVNIINGPKE